MNKIEIIKDNSAAAYVLKSKKGYYLTENDGWTKDLKNAYYFINCYAAQYMQVNDFNNCKVVEVRVRTSQAVEEIGEVKE